MPWATELARLTRESSSPVLSCLSISGGTLHLRIPKSNLFDGFLNSGTCNAHIGMGVRYNAEKKKIGKYYSTPIFSFRCKCHLCSGWFEIQTDPQACLNL